MNDEPLNELERQLAAASPHGVPSDVRGAVLAGVRRELRSARWDRRLGRLAVALLVIGVCMNAAIAIRSDRGPRFELAGASAEESLVQLAVTVAEATDAPTGRQMARHMAALSGWTLSEEQSAAIDAALTSEAALDTLGGKDG